MAMVIAASQQSGKASPSTGSSGIDDFKGSSLRNGWLSRLLKKPGEMLRNFRGWHTPVFVPAEQPIELFFFHRIFDSLCEQLESRRVHPAQADDPAMSSSTPQAQRSRTVTVDGLAKERADRANEAISDEVREVPLVHFHRAMVRLFKILEQTNIDVCDAKNSVDANMNGKVGWYEFCSFWKDNKIAVRLTFLERLFLTMEDAERSILGRILSVLVFIAILISTGSFVISTLPAFQSQCILEGELGHDPLCKPDSHQSFKDVDMFCVVFFCMEYGLRLMLSGTMRMELVDRDRKSLLDWMVSEETRNPPSFLSRAWRWFSSPANLIDLAAILPWFLTKAAESAGGGESIFIKFIRLTRVIRAIRLGKRFEAVIIVVRSVRRSIRALYVLVLNLLLGVITFGAFIFFFEKGEWDKEKRAYLRPVGVQEFNNATKQWEDVLGRSPFDSIPTCFWWAIVTATTVGYGDMYPTTTAGKAVAGLAMGWSLCVLALPIGVIGNNFSNVWEEYDKEKRSEKNYAEKEKMMLERSSAWSDPLHYSRRVILEVWHDPGLSADVEQREFMGESVVDLHMPPREMHHERRVCELSQNNDKARRRVHGSLTFEYTWKPHLDMFGHSGDQHRHALLPGEHHHYEWEAFGSLEIKVVSGHDLISIDWKGSCASDPYCVVVAYPESPSLDGLQRSPEWTATGYWDGRLQDRRERTPTFENSSDPTWEFQVPTFEIRWTEAGTRQCLAADMRDLDNVIDSKSAPSVAPVPPLRVRRDSKPQHEAAEKEKLELLEQMTLQEEIHHLERVVVPDIHNTIFDVKKDLRLIADALRRQGLGKPANRGQHEKPVSRKASDRHEEQVTDVYRHVTINSYND